MPGATPPHALSGQPPGRRLKLTMPSLDRQPPEMQGSDASPSSPPTHDGSIIPRRPSFSPVTPTISHTSLASVDPSTNPPPQWIDEPEPLPVSLDENPDAIALRATISILQLQRQQSLKDIRALDKLKAAALHQPDKFVENLKAGKLAKPDPGGIIDVDDDDDPDDHIADDTTNLAEVTEPASNSDVSQFGRFPNAQNVVRAPPINWDKYHVVGESLDKLHEQQRKRPGSGDLVDGQGRLQPEHVVAAPYRPFVDKLDPPMATSTPRGGRT